MAVIFRTQTGDVGIGNFTPSKPAGVVTDDFLVLHICYEKGSSVNFGGSGASQWTEINRSDQSTNIGSTVLWRKENGITFAQFNLSGAPKFTWTVARYDGQDLTTPIDVSAGASSPDANDPDPPSVDPTISDGLAIATCGNKSTPTGTPPSGYTERWDRANTADGLSWTFGCEKQLTVDTVEDPGNIISSDDSEWAANTFVVKPAIAGESLLFSHADKHRHILVR